MRAFYPLIRFTHPLTFLPALIAGALGYFASGWIARWYEKVSNAL